MLRQFAAGYGILTHREHYFAETALAYANNTFVAPTGLDPILGACFVSRLFLCFPRSDFLPASASPPQDNPSFNILLSSTNLGHWNLTCSKSTGVVVYSLRTVGRLVEFDVNESNNHHVPYQTVSGDNSILRPFARPSLLIHRIGLWTKRSFSELSPTRNYHLLCSSLLVAFRKPSVTLFGYAIFL